MHLLGFCFSTLCQDSIKNLKKEFYSQSFTPGLTASKHLILGIYFLQGRHNYHQGNISYFHFDYLKVEQEK